MPTGWIASETAETQQTVLVACTDLPKGGSLVIKVFHGAAFTPAEATAVRGLLDEMAVLGAHGAPPSLDEVWEAVSKLPR
mgnify:CR=1 FL=1